MNWWGKLIGGAFGYLLGGALGALLGAVLGHNFDKGLSGAGEDLGPGQQERIQTAFFTALFSVLGAVAKADGHVTQAEIALAERVMREMELTAQKRRIAIELFNQGKASDFPLYEVLAEFKRECGRRQNLVQIFLEILVEAAYADGELHSAEQELLLDICKRLGLPERSFWQAQQRLGAGGGHSRGQSAAGGKAALNQAYEHLGISATATDAEVKNAYRRLMNQHHPDKLVAKGLPEEMMRFAEQKTIEIKKAYDLIRQQRDQA